jgi:hypothetical protein
MKLIAFLILIYIGYRLARGYLAGGTRRAAPGAARPRAGEIDDVMVKDPACGVYFPKRDGIPLRRGAEEIYFCGPACRDRYLAGRPQPKDP